MKLKMEDLRIGQDVEVHFTGTIKKLEHESYGDIVVLETKDGLAYVKVPHLAEVVIPEEIQ